MKIYHSFWEKGYREMTDYLYDLHKLSVLSTLKSHGNIHLITTPKGKEFLGDLPYTSIELFEETIDERYWRMWAISKLYAYKQIVKKGEPFIHIDYDVFLFKKLPEHILNSNIILQHIEDENCINSAYDIDIFKKKCKKKYFFEKTVINFAYNVGIFGGSDLKSLSFYLDNAFRLIFDIENQEFFFNDSLNVSWAYSAIVEQYYLAVCLERLGVKPTLLFHNVDFDYVSKQLGYTHLMGLKNQDEYIDKVKRKIKEYENIFIYN